MSTPERDQQTDVRSWRQVQVQRGPIGIGGVVIAAGICAVVGGLRGVLIGVGVLIGGIVTPAPIGFGLGLAGVLTVAGPAPLLEGAAGIVLTAVFIDEATTYPAVPAQRVLIGTAVAGTALTGTTLVLLRSWSLGLVAVMLLTLTGGGVYVIHRYERVSLGLESESEQ